MTWRLHDTPAVSVQPERDPGSGAVEIRQEVMDTNSLMGNLDWILRKKIFIVKVVRPWRRLPREVVDGPSLAVLKAGVEKVLSNMV